MNSSILSSKHPHPVLENHETRPAPEKQTPRHEICLSSAIAHYSRWIASVHFACKHFSISMLFSSRQSGDRNRASSAVSGAF